MTTFYKNYVALCAKRNESASSVAEAIGATRSSASRWKNGAIPSDTTQRKIADYFGITMAELMSPNFDILSFFSPPDGSEDNNGKTAAPKGDGFTEKYEQLNPQNQEIIDSLVEQLLKGQGPA